MGQAISISHCSEIEWSESRLVINPLRCGGNHRWVRWRCREPLQSSGYMLFCTWYPFLSWGHCSWPNLRPSSGLGSHPCCHDHTGSAIGEFESHNKSTRQLSHTYNPILVAMCFPCSYSKKSLTILLQHMRWPSQCLQLQ